MPQNLTDNPVWAIQTGPAGGEPRVSATIADAFQRSANRSAYLKAQLDTVIDSNQTAARMLRWVDNRPSLLAITASQRVDRMCVVTKTRGVYQFVASSTDDATPSPLVERPNDVALAAPGRWILCSSPPATPNGPAYVGSDGKIDSKTINICDATTGRLNLSAIPNAVISSFWGGNATPWTISGTGTLLVGGIVTLAALAGDFVKVDYEFELSPGSNASTSMGVAVTGAATVSGPGNPTRAYTAEGTYRARAVYTAPVSGNYNHQLQLNALSATSARTVRNVNYEVLVSRA